MIATGTVAVPLLLGSPALTSHYIGADLGWFGTISFSTSSIFDIGVYLAVIGLALMVFESFGYEPVLPLGDPAAPRERLEEAT